MTTEPQRDEKAGLCMNCRRDAHALCASATCTCPDMRKHRNRPGFAVVRDPAPAPPPKPTTLARADNEPVWCDPPETVHGRRPVEWSTLAAPCLDRPGEWLRIQVWPSKTGANSALKKCRADLGDGWDVRAARIPTGSGLWVRRAAAVSAPTGTPT